MGLIKLADDEPKEAEKPRKIARPLADWVQVEFFDDVQTIGGTNIVLAEESDLEAQKRRRREMQGAQEPQEVRQGKMRHARVLQVGPDCKRMKGREGQLCRFVGGVAAYYLNGEEVIFIRDEQFFCWIEEPSNEPPRVLQ